MAINTPALTLAGATEQRTPKRNYILIGHPNPSTGPIAAFGDGSPGVDEKAVSIINAKGGIFIREYNKKLPGRGYKVIDSGRFPVFTKDFTKIIQLFKYNKVEIITGVLTPPDWSTAWRQCHQMGFGPKIAIISKAVLFPTSIEALGKKLGNGLVSEVWWSPNHPFRSSLTGQNCREFCNECTQATGRKWTQVLGFKHAGFEIALDALQRARTLDKGSLRKAIAETDLDTIVGHISYNAEHYSETPLVLGQWISNDIDSWELRIVFNKTYPAIAENSEMIFPLEK